MKSRIWEKKERKYTKALAKIHVTGIFVMQDIRRNFFTQLYRDLYGDAMLVPHPDGHQMMVARN